MDKDSLKVSNLEENVVPPPLAEETAVPTSTYKVAKDQFEYKESKKEKRIKNVVYVFLAGLFYALGYHYFVATCQFAPGGIGGIVAMIQHVLGAGEKAETSGMDYSTLLMLLGNIPLLIPAAKILSKDFVVKTFSTVTIMAIIMFTMSNYIDPTYTKFTITGTTPPEEVDMGTRLISSIIGGAFCGLSLAVALKVNSSTGGADIVGAMLQKKNPHKSVASMIMTVNGVIMLVSFFVYGNDVMPIFLSIIYIFATSTTCDMISNGRKSALKFEVITEHAEEISTEIIETLGHGVTITPAKGMFEHKDKNLLICVIKQRQLSKFKDIIEKYPETFAYYGSVSEIFGKFNLGAKK